jgi:hypothetical protein
MRERLQAQRTTSNERKFVMNNHHYTSNTQQKRKQRFVVLLPIVLLLSMASARAGDDDKPQCRAYYGPFTSTVIPPPACQSPVGLCTHGILVGEFPATYDFTALTQKTDATDPNTIILTGKSIVTTPTGVIHTNDVSVINLATGDFVTKAIVNHSNLHQDNSGGFIAAGNLNLATGQAQGKYSAVLCSREDD